MSWIFYIFILLIFLIFIPIPIKIKLTYIDFKLSVFLYGFKINLNKKTKNNKKKAYKSKPKKKFDYNLDNIRTIIHDVDCSKYKPKLNISIRLKLGFFDASITALIYGMLHSLSPLIYRILNMIFKITSYKFDVNPEFKNDIINIELRSIIFISLAKIIYVSILIKNSIKRIKTCSASNLNV